jgi:mRNA-degrading endonuclease RelE of RelBE toxin-antitoxin system
MLINALPWRIMIEKTGNCGASDMQIIIAQKVIKYIQKTNEPDKSRLRQALVCLKDNPPRGDIKSLSGVESYRLRVGKYRFLLDIIDGKKIKIYDVGLRGQIYTKRSR